MNDEYILTTTTTVVVVAAVKQQTDLKYKCTTRFAHVGNVTAMFTTARVRDTVAAGNPL